jgi:hypothetical protein
MNGVLVGQERTSDAADTKGIVMSSTSAVTHGGGNPALD